MKLDPKQNRLLSLAMLITSRLLVTIVALSLIAMLVPIGSASAGKSNTMTCCIGKHAGHCDSRLTAKKPPPQPKPEPICGLKPAAEVNDGITIFAEPAGAESPDSSSPAAGTASISKPCPMDCCASAGSSRQQKRDRASARSTTPHNLPLTTFWRPETPRPTIASHEAFERARPRGPPISRRAPVTSN